MSHRRPLVIAVAVLLIATVAAQARVLSYAPYTDRISVPAMGYRLARHFAVVETSSTAFTSFQGLGQVVLYDSKGEEEPRVIFPPDGSEPVYEAVVVRERGDEPPMILVVTNFPKWFLSVDAGKTWKTLPITSHIYSGISSITADTGGPYARGRYSGVRIGTPEVPFVAATRDLDGYRLRSIGADGTTNTLAFNANEPIQLLGSDFDHNRFLVRIGREFDSIDLNGVKKFAGPSQAGAVEGWLTSAGAFVEVWQASNDIALWFFSGGIPAFVAGTFDKSDPSALKPPPTTVTNYPFFAVPTANYEGAWMVKRSTGGPTQLLEYNPLGGSRALITHWSDITGPEVEAIHPSVGGDKVLIQVHRQRRSADALQIFKDPALAVWHVGTPAPKSYDELYLAEQTDKGFVHLDVDKLESGEPFVFDSGRTVNFSGGGVSAGGGGGADVVQEWGVIRSALAQHLVLPGFGRTAGAFGSLWRTDLTFSNPNDAPVKVALRFVASGDGPVVAEARTARIELAPHELRLVADAARELFGLEGGVGALFIDPEAGTSINVTGRTYTAAAGTYGYGMNAVDMDSAASSRFPVTFAAAFQGTNFRTNLFMADVSGRGSAGTFTATTALYDIGFNTISVEMSPFGVLQRNGLEAILGLPIETTGALNVRPTRGEAVAAVFSIDNRTNDSTFFPPDLSAGTTRTIPVIGHLAGANGSEFRSDVFFLNTSNVGKPVILEARMWSSPSDFVTMSFTLQPHESRVLPDILKSLFNRTGLARLRVVAGTSTLDSSVRVTSRTYTVDPAGGTYGFLMPPLNGFQSATTGDTLEILGTALDPRFRTNLGLVDVTNTFSSIPPRARIDVVGTNGTVVDSFETTIPSLGGTQLNDLFRARSLSHNGAPVLLRITPLQGMIGAYAAMVDNASNDPMYFAANLAAK